MKNSLKWSIHNFLPNPGFLFQIAGICYHLSTLLVPAFFFSYWIFIFFCCCFISSFPFNHTSFFIKSSPGALFRFIFIICIFIFSSFIFPISFFIAALSVICSAIFYLFDIELFCTIEKFFKLFLPTFNIYIRLSSDVTKFFLIYKFPFFLQKST